MLEELAVPKLWEPIFLTCPTFDEHAEAYARGNILQRQLMSLLYCQLELRRINALMIAAQYVIEIWVKG